ncbi:hypothetical protein [Pedobacter suwonensis]|uniref:hypothetical protein n=1 Tax=Pedobacter suwonensis TaxID=332999 RepID=UPI0011A4DF27|nr:hypothetical protein [Pedobacter suwonensis]
MDFFKTADFDFFSSLRGQVYNKDEARHIQNKHQLQTDSVFTKTEHWAELIESHGYNIHVSMKWQNSGYYRNYTWAKIMLHGASTKRIYFTIGVGSRLTNEDSVVNTLDIKLDCERSNKDALPPSVIYEFDKYIRENCPSAARVFLDIGQITSLTWESLVEKTIKFIDCYREHYFRLIELSEIIPIQKIARICWNENNWSRPSGPFGKSKNSDASFEREKGYGYEEWLFNPDRNLGGYHYSFIQAFNKGDHQGKTYTLNVYAIKRVSNSLSEYYWVGKFRHLEVLTNEQQQHALTEFRQRGWLGQMVDDLAQHGISGFDYSPVQEDKIFNIRYDVSPQNFIRFDPPVKIESPQMEIGKNSHYVCLEKRADFSIDELPIGKFSFKLGHKSGKTGIIKGKRIKNEFSMSLIHKEMQTRIYEQLCEENAGNGVLIGTENDTGFGTSIDLVMNCPQSGYTFYEIKTYGSVLSCLREAIGQLFEYNYYSQNNYARKLIIIGLNSPKRIEREYLQHLRKILVDIDIYYQVFSRERQLLLNVLY